MAMKKFTKNWKKIAGVVVVIFVAFVGIAVWLSTQNSNTKGNPVSEAFLGTSLPFVQQNFPKHPTEREITATQNSDGKLEIGAFLGPKSNASYGGAQVLAVRVKPNRLTVSCRIRMTDALGSDKNPGFVIDVDNLMKAGTYDVEVKCEKIDGTFHGKGGDVSLGTDTLTTSIVTH